MLGKYVMYKNLVYLVVKEGVMLGIFSPIHGRKQVARKSITEANMEPAKIANVNGANYIVTQMGNIFSVTTGKHMKWGDDNGNRKQLLDIAGVTK